MEDRNAAGEEEGGGVVAPEQIEVNNQKEEFKIVELNNSS